VFSGRGGGEAAASVVHLLISDRVKKGQIETLREHQRDASYDIISSRLLWGVSKKDSRAKAENPLKRSKGLVLSR
jgi:hypothetical protein